MAAEISHALKEGAMQRKLAYRPDGADVAERKRVCVFLWIL